jgi:hypothetical protein
MAGTTWNPLDKSANCVLTNGNLTAGASGASNGARSVDGHLAGKYYWELTWNLTQTTDAVGISAAGASLTTAAPLAGQRCLLAQGGSIFLNGGTAVGGVGGSVSAGSVICIALDCTGSLIWFRVGAAGIWNNSAGNNPATGVGGVAMVTILGGLRLYAHEFTAAASATVVANFGDSAFTGAVPSGFVSGFPAGGDVVPGSQGARAMVLA